MEAWRGQSLLSVKDYTMCFACGQENPIGLKLSFRREGETVKTEFTPGELHQGWPGVVHVGIINSTITRRMRKLIETKAKIALEDDTPVAEGKAIMYIVEEA